MDILEQRLSQISGGKILDVATGTGDFLEFLKDSMKDYDELVGIDLAEAKFDKARKLFEGEKVDFLKMDACNMAFSDSCFDTVSISDSLHHMSRDEIEKTLREMYRVLRPGGTLVIFEMFQDNQTEKQKNFVELHHWWAAINRLEGISHNPTFLREEIIGFAKSLNLKSIETIEYLYQEDKNEHEKQLENFYDSVDVCIKKLRELPDSSALKEEGARIRENLKKNGFDWPTHLTVIGVK